MIYLAASPLTESTALRAVDGYLYFGMETEALAVLDGIDAAQQNDAAVLLARGRVFLHMKRWSCAEALSRQALEAHPTAAEFTVQLAFALHRLEQIDEAGQAILSAPEWIRRTGILHYNLACYEARLGAADSARRCIATAIQLNASMKLNARRDPDLQSIWN